MAAPMIDQTANRKYMDMYHFFLFASLNFAIISSVSCLDIFSPDDILIAVDNSCLVLLSEFSNEDTSAIHNDLATQIFREETNVTFGFIELIPFVWPNGAQLSYSTSDSGQPQILIFERKIADRTCLLMKPPPSVRIPRPIAHTGILNKDILTNFINSKCQTYRSTTGMINIEGLHRAEILRTLYSVSMVSDVTMQVLSEHMETNLGSTTEKIQNMKSQEQIKTHIHPKQEEETCQPGGSSNEDGETCDTHVHVQNVHDVYTPGHETHTIEIPEIPTCDRISVPTTEEFFHEYLKISRPVIIKNVTKSWPAFKKWTNDYLRAEYGNNEVHIKLTPRGEYEGVEHASLWDNYKEFAIPNEVKMQLQHPELVVVRPATLNVKFSEFLDMIENISRGDLKNISAYLEYSSIPQHLPELEEDIAEMPFIKSGNHKLEQLNIWLSDGSTLGKLHFDPYDNFLCQIHGQKEVILFEPHDNTKLYEAHIPEAMLAYNKTSGEFRRWALVDSTSMVMSPVDILKPDFQTFPRFAEARPLNCTLMEGDVLFMPSFWWHEVQSTPDTTAGHNLAVNYWYDPFLTKEFPCPECPLDINPRYRHLL